MRAIVAGGRLVEVHVRESRRARRIHAVHRYGETPELVVPAGTGEGAIDRALAAHGPWIALRVVREPERVLELGAAQIGERDGRALARERVTEVAEREAERLAVTYERITIRDQRSRWGSCSVAGTLSFNWRLVLAPGPVLDYVVVHELCHLRVQGHSPRFWRLVERTRPAYEVERAWLRDHGWELLTYRPAP